MPLDLSNEFLDKMRLTGDEWADKVVLEMEQEGGNDLVRTLFAKVASIEEVVPEGVPDYLREFLTKNEAPDWVDLEQVKRGELYYIDHGVVIGALLLFASLPACYAASNGVNVLYISHQLTKHPGRRLLQTSRFMIDVMMPGGLTDSAKGVPNGVLTARKVRLLHAINRYIQLNDPSSPYDMKWGIPLNQEDLALTLMTFSITILNAMTKVGVTPTKQEADDYFAAWRYVGFEMGIVEELLPATVAEGQAMMDAISKRQYGPSEAGRVVTRALTDFLEELIPGHWLDGLAASNIRFLMGDEVGDMLGVDKQNWTHSLVLVEKFLLALDETIRDNTPLHGVVHDILGRILFEGMEKIVRVDDRPAFQVPESLRSSWGMKPASGSATHAVVMNAEDIRAEAVVIDRTPAPKSETTTAP